MIYVRIRSEDGVILSEHSVPDGWLRRLQELLNLLMYKNIVVIVGTVGDLRVWGPIYER